MAPQSPAIGGFIKKSNTYPIGIGHQGFCYDIHGHLAEIEVRPNTARCRNARFLIDVANHGHGKGIGRHAIRRKVRRGINHDFINGIDMDVLRSNVLQINAVDVPTHFDIALHARHGDNIRKRFFRMMPKL